MRGKDLVTPPGKRQTLDVTRIATSRSGVQLQLSETRQIERSIESGRFNLTVRCYSLSYPLGRYADLSGSFERDGRRVRIDPATISEDHIRTRQGYGRILAEALEAEGMTVDELFAGMSSA